MTISILYICTGNYIKFWREFYLSAEEKFIPGARKTYYVFTDAPEIDFEHENPNICRIFQKNLGWPYNTLKRYEIFIKHQDLWENSDYTVFFNANVIFLQAISATEFLPQSGKKLIAAVHSGFFNKDRSAFTYERNPSSLAFMGPDEGRYYVCGAINGGVTADFLMAIQKMSQRIEEDLGKGIVAVWHDESHWNKYVWRRSDVKFLSPSYLVIEGTDIPFKRRILLASKERFGGFDAMRGTKTSQWKRAKVRIGKAIRSI